MVCLPPVQHRLPTYVEADLAITPLSAALAGSGLDASCPAVFTCEGLVYYLPPAAVDAFLEDWGTIAVTGAPAISYIPHFNPDVSECALRGPEVTVPTVSDAGRSDQPGGCVWSLALAIWLRACRRGTSDSLEVAPVIPKYGARD